MRHIRHKGSVWLRNTVVKAGSSKKFRFRWTGPFTVTSKTSEVNYRIKPDLMGQKLQIVHVNRLKKCFTPKIIQMEAESLHLKK